MHEDAGASRGTLRDVVPAPVRRGGPILRGAIVVVTLVAVAGLLHQTGTWNTASLRVLLGSLGWSGLSVYVAYSLSIFLPMGASWLLVMGQPWRRLRAFAWARMLREAAADLLPFSQVGGIVIGADSLTARGLPTAAVYAGMTADLGTEMISQALFTVMGIAFFASATSAPVDPAAKLAIAVGLVVIGLIAAVAWTAPRWMAGAVPRILWYVMPRSLPFVKDVTDRLRTMYAYPARLVGSIVLNFIAWSASAAGAWIVLRFMGCDVALSRVLSLEALVFALRSVAFMVPAGIGVQEAGYVLFAASFGLPIETVVVLAFAKRCKDVAIGLPTLLVWQFVEVRRFTGLARAMKTKRSIADPAA